MASRINGDQQLRSVIPRCDYQRRSQAALPGDLIRIAEPTLFSRLVIATSCKHTLSQLAVRSIAMLESKILPLYGTAT
jgi:hypothetical protein